MGKMLSANFIDRLLARLNGEVSAIWISQINTFDEGLDRDLLWDSFKQLIQECPKLNVSWNLSQDCWESCDWSLEQLEAAFTYRDQPTVEAPLIQKLIQMPIDLAREIPFRVGLYALNSSSSEKWLFSIQLHHAIGDARSLIYLTQRYWERVTGALSKQGALIQPGMTNLGAVQQAMQRVSSLRYLLRPQYRTFAKRGQALQRMPGSPARQAEVGLPLLASLRFSLPVRAFQSEKPSELFYAAVLGGISGLSQSPRGRIRFRIPIDLRNLLKRKYRTLENACSALSVEFEEDELNQLVMEAPKSLGQKVESKLKDQLSKNIHWATLLECWGASKAVSRSSLRTGARADLNSDIRSNTLVVTYVGRMDRYARNMPFQLKTVRTHTSTWGVNGLAYRGHLYVNFTGFEGIGSQASLRQFAEASLQWMRTHHAIEGEVL